MTHSYKKTMAYRREQNEKVLEEVSACQAKDTRSTPALMVFRTSMQLHQLEPSFSGQRLEREGVCQVLIRFRRDCVCLVKCVGGWELGEGSALPFAKHVGR